MRGFRYRLTSSSEPALSSQLNVREKERKCPQIVYVNLNEVTRQKARQRKGMMNHSEVIKQSKCRANISTTPT